MPDEDDDGMDTEDDDAPPAVASEPKPTPAPFRMAVMQAKGGPPPKHPKKAKVVRPKDSRQNNGNKRRQAEQEVPTSRPAVAAMSSGEEGQGRRYTASEKGKMRGKAVFCCFPTTELTGFWQLMLEMDWKMSWQFILPQAPMRLPLPMCAVLCNATSSLTSARLSGRWMRTTPQH
jgi:hypothetical protein